MEKNKTRVNGYQRATNSRDSLDDMYTACPFTKEFADIKLLRAGKQTDVTDQLAGDGFIEYQIDKVHFKSSKPITIEAKRLYFFTMTMYATKGNGSDCVTFTLDEWAAARRVENKRREKNNLLKVVNELKHVQIQISGKGEKGYCVIYQEFTYKANTFTFVLSKRTHDIFKKYKKVYFYKIPQSIFSINLRLYPYAFALCVYVCNQKRINAGKGHGNADGCHEDIFMFSTLLKLCEDCGMPSAAHLQNGLQSNDRHVKRRIIDVFINNMNELYSLNVFDWCICDKYCNIIIKRKKMRETLQCYSFSEIIEMRVMIIWINEPDYTDLKRIKRADSEYKQFRRVKERQKRIRAQAKSEYEHTQKTA